MSLRDVSAQLARSNAAGYRARTRLLPADARAATLLTYSASDWLAHWNAMHDEVRSWQQAAITIRVAWHGDVVVGVNDLEARALSERFARLSIDGVKQLAATIRAAAALIGCRDLQYEIALNGADLIEHPATAFELFELVPEARTMAMISIAELSPVRASDAALTVLRWKSFAVQGITEHGGHRATNASGSQTVSDLTVVVRGAIGSMQIELRVEATGDDDIAALHGWAQRLAS